MIPIPVLLNAPLLPTPSPPSPSSDYSPNQSRISHIVMMGMVGAAAAVDAAAAVASANSRCSFYFRLHRCYFCCHYFRRCRKTFPPTLLRCRASHYIIGKTSKLPSKQCSVVRCHSICPTPHTLFKRPRNVLIPLHSNPHPHNVPIPCIQLIPSSSPPLSSPLILVRR